MGATFRASQMAKDCPTVIDLRSKILDGRYYYKSLLYLLRFSSRPIACSSLYDNYRKHRYVWSNAKNQMCLVRNRVGICI